jgi:hypothetical protein
MVYSKAWINLFNSSTLSLEEDMARSSKTLTTKVDLNYVMCFGFLAHICPKSLIDNVLTKLHKLSKRVRLFPAAAVVYFVITMSLWREAPTEEILRILVENINLVNDGKTLVICPNKAAISEARIKLGSEVMRQLADSILQPVAPMDFKQAWYKNMRLMAFDGSTFDLPDEKVNAEFYGYPSSHRGESAFPQARILGLVETGTRVLTAAEIGPYKRSEKDMAKAIIKSGKLKSNMLLLADRGFYGYDLWTSALSTDAKLLWRVKTNMNLDEQKRLPDGSYISTVYDSTNKLNCEPISIRVIEYKLKDKKDRKSNEKNIGEPFYRLFTNIFDHELAPANELAALYHERWEIETLFSEFKTSLYNNSTVIRSKTPILVEQELWGLIILHFALRQLMAKAAWTINLDPDYLSFKKTIYILRRKIPQFAVFSPTDAS